MCANLVDANVFLTANSQETDFVIDMPIELAAKLAAIRPQTAATPSTQLKQAPTEQAPILNFPIRQLQIGLIDDDSTVRSIFRFVVKRHFAESKCVTFQFENADGRAVRTLLERD